MCITHVYITLSLNALCAHTLACAWDSYSSIYSLIRKRKTKISRTKIHIDIHIYTFLLTHSIVRRVTVRKGNKKRDTRVRSAKRTENRRNSWDTQWCDFVRKKKKKWEEKRTHKFQCLTESIIVVTHQLLFRFAVLFAFAANSFHIFFSFVCSFVFSSPSYLFLDSLPLARSLVRSFAC